MNVDWTARGATVPEGLKTRIEQQIGKLERYLRGHTEASVVVSHEGDPEATGRQSFELIVRNRLGTFTARDESPELVDAANAVIARVQAQVHKAHDKMLAGRRRNLAEPAPEEPAGE